MPGTKAGGRQSSQENARQHRIGAWDEQSLLWNAQGEPRTGPALARRRWNADSGQVLGTRCPLDGYREQRVEPGKEVAIAPRFRLLRSGRSAEP